MYIGFSLLFVFQYTLSGRPDVTLMIISEIKKNKIKNIVNAS